MAFSWTRNQRLITHLSTVLGVIQMFVMVNRAADKAEADRKQMKRDQSPGYHTALEWAEFT